MHLPGDFLVQVRFRCEFTIDDQVITLNAQLLSDTIYCESFEFTTKSSNLSSLKLNIYGGSIALSNPNDVHGNSFEKIYNFLINFEELTINGYCVQYEISADL